MYNDFQPLSVYEKRYFKMIPLKGQKAKTTAQMLFNFDLANKQNP